MRVVGNRYILLVDTISLIIGGIGLYNIHFMKLPPHLEAAGHWQFLTNLSLVFSLIIFALGFISHVTKNNSMYQVKNFLHPFGFVCEIMVFGIYWPLRLFFMHLLVKDVSEFHLTLPVDLSIHLMPVLSLGIDFFMFMPNWTVSTNLAFTGCIILTTSYWIWLHNLIDFDNGGEFPYAFMNVKDTIIRGCIFGVVGLLAFMNFILMRFLYGKFIHQMENKTHQQVKNR